MRRYHTYMAIPYNYNYTVCSRMRDGRNNQPNECKNELTMKSCLAENHFDALAIACCFFFSFMANSVEFVHIFRGVDEKQ